MTNRPVRQFRTIGDTLGTPQSLYESAASSDRDVLKTARLSLATAETKSAQTVVLRF